MISFDAHRTHIGRFPDPTHPRSLSCQQVSQPLWRLDRGIKRCLKNLNPIRAKLEQGSIDQRVFRGKTCRLKYEFGAAHAHRFRSAVDQIPVAPGDAQVYQHFARG